MRTERKREGYLLIDHRNSPGVTPEFLSKMGVDPALAVAGGKTFEASTLNCVHCGTTVVLNPARTRERARCWRCNKYMCDKCAKVDSTLLKCEPLEKQIDEAGNRAVLGLPVGVITRG